jgi:hypothetical protein
MSHLPDAAKHREAARLAWRGMPLAHPSISVVIPTKSRPGRLQTSLEAVVRAAEVCHEPVEVIVVDDAPETETCAVVEAVCADACCPVRYLAAAEFGARGPGEARNLGVQHASGNIIAFTDDDTRCDPAWLSTGTARLRADGGLAGVEGAVRADISGEGDLARARVVTNTRGGGYLTASMLVRREAFEAVGGFRAFGSGALTRSMPFREDTDLALRIVSDVGPIAFDPACFVWHPVEQLRLPDMLRIAGYFVVDAAFLRAHRSRFPSFVAAPAARLRIRLACLCVASAPLLMLRRTRLLAAGVVTAAAVAVDLQVEVDLAGAGLKRPLRRIAADVLRRLPRALLWCLAAGSARLAGEAMLRFGQPDRLG